MQLGQSPLLNILSDRKVEETLHLMGKVSSERITREMARELCIRTDSKAFLVGSISNLGNQYVLGLDAIGCSTGDTLAKEQLRGGFFFSTKCCERHYCDSPTRRNKSVKRGSERRESKNGDTLRKARLNECSS